MISTTISCFLALACPQQPALASPEGGSAAAQAVEQPVPGAAASATPAPSPSPAGETQPAENRPPRILRHADVFPPDTVAAMAMAPLEKHGSELAKTGIEDLLRWAGPAWRNAEIFAPLALGPVALESLPVSGFDFAITRVGKDGTVEWLLVVPSKGRAAAMRKDLGLAHKQHESRQCEVSVQLLGVDQAWTVTRKGGPSLSYMITDEAILIAGSAATIQTAVAQKADPSTSLQNTDSYRRFATRCAEEGSPFLSVFVAPQVALAAGMNLLPNDEARDAVQQVLGQLGLDQVQEFGVSLFAAGRKLRDFTWIGCPGPRSGLLASLLDGSGPVDPAQLRAIAPDAIAASLFTMDLPEAFASATRLLPFLHPSVRGPIQARLDQFRKRSGLDLAQDVLPLFGKRVTIQEFATVDYTRVWGLTLDIADRKQFQGLLDTLVEAFELQRGTINSIPAIAIPDLLQAGRPALLTLHGDTLIVGSSAAFLDRVVSLLKADGRENQHQLANPLRRRGELPTRFGWADCAGVSRHWMRTLSSLAGHRLIADELARAVVSRGGACAMSVTADEAGFALRSDSPFGNVYFALTAAYLVKLRELEADTGSALADRRMSVVRDVLAAQLDFHLRRMQDEDGDKIPEYGRITDLVRAGLVSPRWFGSADAEPLQTQEYRFRIFLPKTPDEREQSFLLLAWPTPQTSGVAYAATANGSIYANKIIGQTGNLKLCDPRDFFAGGTFDGEILPSWEVVESRSRRAATTEVAADLRGLNAEEQSQMTVLDNAVSTGTVTTEVLDLLSARNAKVVARAAAVLGSLRHRGSVPQLCERVLSHPSPEVKRQAMNALCKIRDMQSVATAIQALTSDDPELRRFAAHNLGFLHATQAMQPLLDVLSLEAGPDAPDRTATLLALADIGQPDCLLPAATRVKSDGEEDQKALVYLFQTLSPKLGNIDETKLMMAILDDDCELLRRFAIQRLGVLKNPISVPALTARLPKETALRDLIEVSLNVIRGQQPTGKLKTYLSTAKRRAKEIWNSVPIDVLYAIGAGVILLLVLFRSVRRRRYHSRTAERFAAMVAPSEDFANRYDHVDEDDADYGSDEYEPVEYSHFDRSRRNQPEDDGDWDGEDFDEAAFDDTPVRDSGRGRRPARR